MQPSINEKFHYYICPNLCLLRFRVCLDEANPGLKVSIRFN